MKPNRNPMQKPRGGLPHLQKRITNITKKFDGNTQKIRAQLILDLKTLLEVATDQVLSTTGPKTKNHQNWTRLAAYISQVINSISKTYDINQIQTELEELQKMVEKMNTNEHDQNKTTNQKT